MNKNFYAISLKSYEFLQLRCSREILYKIRPSAFNRKGVNLIT